MLRRIEALFLGGRWRRDEYAWRVWQEVEPLIPERFPEPGELGRYPEVLRMAGRVVRIYQHARRGSKAVVDFGPVVGLQDTWWEHKRPPVGNWVIVQAHLWLPPGTHSEQQVFWIDQWESWAAGDTPMRAQRHQRRMEKETASQGATGARAAAPLNSTQGSPQSIDDSHFPTSAGPLFQTTAMAFDAGLDQVMSTASEIAAGMGARAYGPAEVGGGVLLSVWPAAGEPTFASVTARSMPEGGAWVGVSAQSLRSEALDIVDDISGALQSRLGGLETRTNPPERVGDYDRGVTRKLEAEIQDLLEAMSADPSAWEHLSRAVYEREVLLQHLTELGA